MMVLIPSPTLFRYVSRNYLVNFLALLLIMLGLIYVFDLIEMMRRAAKVDGVPFTSLLGLAALRVPSSGQVLMPFAVMFAAVYTCWRLTKTQEIVIMRTAGLSAWQFLMPMVATAVALGIAATTLINPLSAVLISRYEQRRDIILRSDDNQMIVSKTGIWLRQLTGEPGGADSGYALIHADAFSQQDWRLSGVTVFNFDADDQFRDRLESKLAYLRDGYWEFRDASQYRRDGTSRFSVKHLATRLTPTKIEETFSDPETISFWDIPEYVNLMEETGFPTVALRIHFQSLLAKPLLFAALILLAATFSLRPPRFGGTGVLIGLGVLAGFFIFFVESILQAFGISQKIPVVMAAWTPALLTLLLGTAALLHTEDG